MKKIICLDVETTGVDIHNDEILQLSLIDQNFEVLFNEYLRPPTKQSWKTAQRFNGISPEMVMNNKTLLDYRYRIEELINSADVLVGYNLKSYDIPIIKSNGIYIDDSINVFDVMLEFPQIYGEVSGNYNWQKLTKCAEYYDYQFNAHDSLEDTKATLHCYYKISEEIGLK